ncbi:FAD/NAD(P)-binding domain-containing protein [Aspergillus pseudoustus]|uniref:FAD/NAD(P)-binding domain-containing protein n=1 Tax=Aspergillus pseudoustus TaxID=1810923 RepID=A0ABR4JI81_9EURO
MTITPDRWRRLSVGIIGGGIGGLSAAIALRRAGHIVTVYERAESTRDAGASISCPANGSKWLANWGVNIKRGQPITILKQIRRDLETGEVLDVLDLSGYADKWGHDYYNFYRVDMYRMLLSTATAAHGKGVPVTVAMDHICNFLDVELATVGFTNGLVVQHDLIVGADGVGSCIRRFLGIEPVRKRATSSCIHCVINTSDVHQLGLPEMARSDALEYWGQGLHKIVYSACRAGSIQSFYLFFPLSSADLDDDRETWLEGTTSQQALKPYPTLDPKLRTLLAHSVDIRPWRLFEHDPYPTWQRSRTCIMGDAAHPMLPDQSQGACQAIEDAAALGVIFSHEYTYTSDISAGLQLYERVRKPRASKVQAASARARRNLSERIGFSSKTESTLYRVENESQKLTIEEINGYNMAEHIASLAEAKFRAVGERKWQMMAAETTS